MPLTWRGAAEQYSSTDPVPLGKPLPPGAGVYIVCKFENQRYVRPIYIGECEDLNEQITNLESHRQYSCFVKRGATHVCAILITGARQLRLTVEADLRAGLYPPCN